MDFLAQDSLLTYDLEYFSGSQIAIYLGDVWIDEVTAFTMEVMQNKEPIYGYASELFDDIGRGPKLVRGSFAINFKEAGYMFAALKHYRETKTLNGKLDPYGGQVGKTNEYKINRRNVEDTINNTKEDPAFAKTMRDMAGFATTAQFQNKGIDKAENLFEAFEDAIWKGGGQSDALKGYTLESRSSLRQELNGFDIYVQFGDHTNDLLNHTIIKLENVHLTGQSMVIESSGRPVQEAYSFLARNWI